MNLALTPGWIIVQPQKGMGVLQASFTEHRRWAAYAGRTVSSTEHNIHTRPTAQ